MAHGIATRLVRLAGAFLLAAAALPSWAQSKARPPEAMDGAWHFTIALYFWASGISGTASVATLPEVPVDMPFSDIFSELDFGALGYFEARRDRFGISADVVYVNLGVPVETGAPVIGSLSLQADVRSTIAEGFLFYGVATGGDATTTSDSGDHQLGRVVGITAGTFNAANPFSVCTSNQQTAVTAVSISGTSTSTNDTLVFAASASGDPDSNGTARI